ncbi:PfkB family carbohydrate kinase [Thiohalobacter sp. IOR34]|uniref:PfkB family carbohydrate kinase n=1 Tax=Thiohalobacter sp. IOR34 TaxID=3057176 RepID=UPI0025B2036E|nr:PfkB family carbohydrate kinase [Thiohalobacter sp. IOR34]WJW75833.1 PfkB family carbohydrate kinase [Thiohalobacter sp. IOR34]
MACILAVGIATLDIVNRVPAYPPEDSELRALDQRLARGGNATNSLVVLARLGHRCRWAGVLGDGPEAGLIEADLAAHGVETRDCRRLAGRRMPTSCILLSAASGSRSIVHYRDLPEYRSEDFARIDLAGCDWLHFEGRAPEETGAMLADARRRAPSVPRSLEIEKPRPGIEALFGEAELLIVSRAFAEARGLGSARALLQRLREGCPSADLVCAWGAAGAAAWPRGGDYLWVDACRPPRVLDTLGAGDVFNAGLIDARLRGLDWPAALAAATRLAGEKCGRIGFDGLGRGA